MLELFFDLVFVVAVSIASAELHHALTEGEFLHGITSYAITLTAGIMVVIVVVLVIGPPIEEHHQS